MGKSGSKADPSLMPRDGTDEIDVTPKPATVSKREFDELASKFDLLEQLMQKDKDKLFDLESSLSNVQNEKKILRQSVHEIDNEIKRDKSSFKTSSETILQEMETKAKEKYDILEKMIDSQSSKVDHLVKEIDEKYKVIQRLDGDIKGKIEHSLQSERTEVQRLVQSSIAREEDNRSAMEKRMSSLIDTQMNESLSAIHQQLEVHKQETVDVKNAIHQEKDNLNIEKDKMEQMSIQIKQEIEENQRAKLEHTLASTKLEMEEKLESEKRDRAHLENAMKTLVDTKVGEHQRDYMTKIQTQETFIQAELDKLNSLQTKLDNIIKENHNSVLQQVEQRVATINSKFEENIIQNEEKKEALSKRISQNFETRILEVQSSLTSEVETQRKRADTILEEKESEKQVLSDQIQLLQQKIDTGMQDSQTSLKSNFDQQIIDIRESIDSKVSSKASNEDIAALQTELSGVRASTETLQTGLEELHVQQQSVGENISTACAELKLELKQAIELALDEYSPIADPKVEENRSMINDVTARVHKLPNLNEHDEHSVFTRIRQQTAEKNSILLDRITDCENKLDTIDLDLKKKCEEIEATTSSRSQNSASDTAELLTEYKKQVADLSDTIFQQNNIIQELKTSDNESKLKIQNLNQQLLEAKDHTQELRNDLALLKSDHQQESEAYKLIINELDSYKSNYTTISGQVIANKDTSEENIGKISEQQTTISTKLSDLEELLNNYIKQSGTSLAKTQEDFDYKLKEQEQIFDDKLAQMKDQESFMSVEAMNSTLTNKTDDNPFTSELENGSWGDNL